MENKYGLYSPGSSGWTSLRNEEFQEEDVWEAFQEIHDSISREKTAYMSKGLQYPARAIPNPNRYSYSSEPEIIQRRSTPLSIPICSETYKNSRFWLDADSNVEENNRGFARNRWNSDIEEEDYDDGEIEESTVMIPPHVWIAQKIRPSSSVCEGAGRTLKGRDLLSVRNAVLSKTGFLESKSN
ncbi:protein S40-6-like [Primulina eburnea]|uniref:protein S40-6-like n=1 Tax=Primulina eburnea TaxID=1245227 RepID=UPI003C6C23B1